MMKHLTTFAGAALLAGVAFGAAPASAQVEDLDPAAVAAATRYALPLAFEGFMTRCFDRLDNEGYAVTNAEGLRAKFSDGADAAWPGARSLIIEMASEEADNMTDIFEMLDDDALRPFVDGLVENMVAQEIRPEDCETIERGLEIFDPLPADNMAAIVGFIVELVGNEETRDASGETEMTESRARKLREQEEGRR